MKEIKLTQGKFALVDNWNYDYLNQWKWCVLTGRSGSSYAIRRNGKILLMHCVIMELKLPDYIGEVDHKDHDGLNNCEFNLRVASHRQNTLNQRVRSDNTSGYKGVNWYKKTNKWRARICIQGRDKRLGYFTSKEAAALAYDYAAISYFGEFACLNFPENWSVEKINRVHVTGLYLLG